MPNKFTPEEYTKMLPKKQVGTAVIFFNTSGELLMVKPNYKEGWLVPGGSTDAGESPLQCALRETKEEIGLGIVDMRLVGVYHNPARGFYPDHLKFIFFGGVLTDEQIAKIVLQKDELEEYTFKSPSEAVLLLTPSLRNSLPKCFEAIREKTVVCIDA